MIVPMISAPPAAPRLTSPTACTDLVGPPGMTMRASQNKSPFCSIACSTAWAKTRAVVHMHALGEQAVGRGLRRAVETEDVEKLGRPLHLALRQVQQPARGAAQFLALGQQGLAVPQLFFRGLPLGDLDLQRGVGAQQFRRALLDGCLERTLSTAALRAPGKTHQGEYDEGPKRRQFPAAMRRLNSGGVQKSSTASVARMNDTQPGPVPSHAPATTAA